MAQKISLNLITGRTIQQGVSMEAGKDKPAYRDACGIIEIEPADFKRLGIWRNSNVKVTSAFGSVVVKAVDATQGPHPGLAYIPMGPWANMVVDPNTYSTGMPTFKGTPIEVEPAPDEPVYDSITLIGRAIRGEAQ
ncbi:MAG: molybdopterin dinucleotide binding domain-containing protein [Methanomicrobiales archaeon]